jgi:ribosome-associated protein
MIELRPGVYLDPEQVEYSAIRAQGAGGQNVNKVASAIHLRFAIVGSSLPSWVQDRLLASGDKRITRDGVVVIKSQRHRTQELNRRGARAASRAAAQRLHGATGTAHHSADPRFGATPLGG